MGVEEHTEERDNHSSDIEKDVKHENGESDYEPARNSLSSQSNEDNKTKRTSRVPKKLTKKESAEKNTRASRGSSTRQDFSKLQFTSPNNSQKRSQKTNRASFAPKALSSKKLENVKVPTKAPSELSEDDKVMEEVKEIDILDEAPICDQGAGTDDESVDTEENKLEGDRPHVCQKIVEMDQKIEKLEEELREVAMLEISLYSVIPEHGSSAHKVHTPARRLSRLYIYACKLWTQDRRATVAKNSVSGLVLIAKSCGNDVPRLTFWLSNTVVLREIISHTFGNLSRPKSVVRAVESNGSIKKREGDSLKLENNSGGQQKKRSSLMQHVDDWQETSTFIAALEKIESWIFSRIVESVWWQTFTPHMQSPVEDLSLPTSSREVLGRALSDQQQGNCSVKLWKSAFRDAFNRICPVRSGGHECGCLPVLARMVMEQCVSRLDVAMFNAILRESEHEMPTDPVSDPIVDPKVLPIPAGHLSFGCGAQLKNSIGNWSRCLADLFDLDVEDQAANGDVETSAGDSGSKSFRLLNELSDLLMLPKDMLFEKSIRKEVCPSIGLPLITRILCNFTPDEFCPDPVPAIVLEDLNTESLLEHRPSEKAYISMNTSFPCSAAPVVYSAPSPADVAAKVADASGTASLDRRASIIQRKGYTSDDDLEDLDFPLTSIIEKTTTTTIHGTPQKENTQANVRYKLLHQVWAE